MNAPDTDRFDANSFIFFLLILAVLIGVAWIAERKTKKRNRYLPDPKPDARGSIEQFRRMHQP